MRFVIDQDNRDQFHWRLIHDNGSDLAVSVGAFDSASAAGHAAEDVRLNAGAAPAPEENPVLMSAASGLG